LFVSRSQHLTILSSPQENRYGCLGETARPRTVEICPVRVSRKFPEARSHILIVRSPAPLANHSLPGSTARLLTQPRWPDITRINFHGACHSGFGCCTVCFRTRLDDGRFLCGVGPLAFGPPPVPWDRSASAVDEASFEAASDFAGIPSISLVV